MSKCAWENYERECAAKRRRVGKTKTATPPQSLLLQRMRTVPNRLKMYEPLDTRDFVDFSGYLFDKQLATSWIATIHQWFRKLREESSRHTLDGIVPEPGCTRVRSLLV